jgi:hypothetical protein
MTRSVSDLRGRAGPSDKRLRTEFCPAASKPTHRPSRPVERRAKQSYQNLIVLTVGHSTRTLKEFVALLPVYGVDQLIDIRTIPRSRYNPQFNRDALPRPLQEAGICYWDLGVGPRIDPAVQEQAYPLSRCMSCCLCMEVRPQFTEPTRFVGAAIINQVRPFNLHPTGAHLRHERLTAMMSDGGVHECSYAQNYVQISPKNIALTASISIVYGQVMKQAIGDLFQKPELTSARKEPGRRRYIRTFG